VAGAGLAAGPFSGFAARAWAGSSAPRGPLTQVADERDGVVRLWLPRGFRYRSFHDTEQPIVLDDGTILPGRHDGMGAVASRDGRYTLIRNHEIAEPRAAMGPPHLVYDPAAGGGTVSVEVDRHGNVFRSQVSLGGTHSNCSGGVLPWGNWVTCEETVSGPDVAPDYTGTPNTWLQQRHGFIFEVPPWGAPDPEPITSAGRFFHEAAAYDPRRGALYLTEDNFGFASGFYRYLPPRHPEREVAGSHGRRIRNGGRLQALAVEGRSQYNLAAAHEEGDTFRVTWVDIDDPAPEFPYTPGETAPTLYDDASTYVSRQGFACGAAWFSRLEGAVYSGDVIYFTSTQGGGPAEDSIGPIADGFGNGYGQVWAYHIEEQILRLVFQSPGPDVLDYPDNVTTSKRGTLIVCEDHNQDNFLRGLTVDGELFDIALNRLVDSSGVPRYDDEFAGTTFSPDGHTLFVNIQASRGMTFAIWGPWARIGI
jgi:uncharacterized protein